MIGLGIELVEDVLPVRETALGQGAMQVVQLPFAGRLEIDHDGQEELWCAGRHGVELGRIEKRHEGTLHEGCWWANWKERVVEWACSGPVRATFWPGEGLPPGKLWWESGVGIVKIS